MKLLIWDLDHTLWDGTLLEGDDVRLRPGVKKILAELDRRGRSRATGKSILLEHPLEEIPQVPESVELEVLEAAEE